MEFQSLFKFWCYSSSIQSWCWYLIWSSLVVLPGGWVVLFYFFFCLSVTVVWSAPPSLRWGSLSLSVVLRFQNQLCSPPAVLLWSWVFTVLVYWGHVSLPCPLSLGQGQWSISWRPAVSVLWWFVVCFSIWQSSLTLDFAHWLRIWALWIVTCPISGSGLSPACCWHFCLSSHCLLKFTQRSATCPYPFSSALSEFLLSLLCASFQFIVYYSVFFFYWRGVSVCPVGYAGLSQGWLGEYCLTLGTNLLSLLNVSQAGLEPVSSGGGSPPVFSV
jgi:hypothetical protein